MKFQQLQLIGKGNCVLNMKRCEKKGTMTAVYEIIYKTLVWLALLQVFTAFVEADMWHFTDPKVNGISCKGVVIFAASLWLSPLLLLSSRIRNFNPGRRITFLLTILEPIVLFIATHPSLSNLPLARTISLACGVAFAPFVAVWLLCNSSSAASFTFRKYWLDIRSIFRGSPESQTGAQTKDRRSTDESWSIDHSRDVKTREADFSKATELLLSVLITMATRWHFGSVNVFYESWRASCAILVTSIALSLPLLMVDACCKNACDLDDFRQRNTSRSTEDGSFGSCDSCAHSCDVDKTDVTQETGLNETIQTVLDGSSTEQLKHETIIEQLLDGSSQLSLAESGSDVKSNKPVELEVERTFVPSDKHRSASQCSVVWLSALADGVGKGVLLNIGIWMFSSPALLCRWAGKSPSEFGVVILLCFSLGVLSVLVLTWLTPKQTKVRESIFNLIVGLLSLAFIFTGACLLLFGAENNVSFAGSCILAATTPCAVHVNFELTTAIAKVTQYSTREGCCCKSSSALGVIAFVATITFALTEIGLMMFINPTVSDLLLGRIHVILYGELSLVALTFVACPAIQMMSTFRAPLPTVATPSWFGEKLKRSLSANRKAIITVVMAMIVLLAYVPAGPQYASQHCVDKFGKTLSALRASTQHADNTTINIMSWNILLGHDMDGRGNLPCVACVVNDVKPDLIGLQESDALPSYWGGKDILSYLAQSTNKKSYSGVQALKSSLGVGLLTSMQVLSHNATILPGAASVKVPHYSFTETVINVTSKRGLNVTNPGQQLLHVFNVHAVFKNWTKAQKAELANMSKLQMEDIAKRIRPINAAESIVLIGDFNLNPYESELDIFYNELGLHSALHPHRSAHPTKSSLRNRHAFVDHIFYRGLELIDAKTLETQNISDHLPIYARFRIAS